MHLDVAELFGLVERWSAAELRGAIVQCIQDGGLHLTTILALPHGDQVSLWQFYGNVILLDISTMWCGPCQQIARHVDETWNDYRDEGFVYLTVLPEDTEKNLADTDDLNEWAEAFDINAPILADHEGYGYAVEPTQQWPVLMLIDRKMTIVADRLTPSDEAVRDAIESEL